MNLLALTRALLANPEVLLFDEFTDSLDINTRLKLKKNFLKLNKVSFSNTINFENIKLNSSKWILKEFEEMQKLWADVDILAQEVL